MLGMFIFGVIVGAILMVIIISIGIAIQEKIEKKVKKEKAIKLDILSVERMGLINSHDINHPPKFEMFDKVKYLHNHRSRSMPDNKTYTVIGMTTMPHHRELTLYDPENKSTSTSGDECQFIKVKKEKK